MFRSGSPISLSSRFVRARIFFGRPAAHHSPSPSASDSNLFAAQFSSASNFSHANRGFQKAISNSNNSTALAESASQKLQQRINSEETANAAETQIATSSNASSAPSTSGFAFEWRGGPIDAELFAAAQSGNMAQLFSRFDALYTAAALNTWHYLMFFLGLHSKKDLIKLWLMMKQESVSAKPTVETYSILLRFLPNLLASKVLTALEHSQIAPNLYICRRAFLEFRESADFYSTLKLVETMKKYSVVFDSNSYTETAIAFDHIYFADKSNVEPFIELWKELKSAADKIVPSITVHSILCRRFSQIRDLKRCKELFRSAQRNGQTFDDELIHSYYSLTREFDDLEFSLELFRHYNNSSIDGFDYSTLIVHYAKRKDFHSIRALLIELSEKVDFPVVRLPVNEVLRSFSSASLDDFISLFTLFQRIGAPIDEFSYCEYLSRLVKFVVSRVESDKPRQLRKNEFNGNAETKILTELFRWQRGTDLNTAMPAKPANLKELVDPIIKQMNSAGFKPDFPTRQTLINGFRVCGDVGSLLVQLSDSIAQHFRPSMIDFEWAAIQLLTQPDYGIIQSDSMDKIRSVIKTAELRPSKVLCHAFLLDGILLRDPMRLAEQLDLMSANKIPLDLHLYNRIMNGFLSAAHPSEVQFEFVFRMFERLKQQKLEPNVGTFNVLLRVHAMKRNFEAMRLVLEEMKSKGILPNRETEIAIQSGKLAAENPGAAAINYPPAERPKSDAGTAESAIQRTVEQNNAILSVWAALESVQSTFLALQKGSAAARPAIISLVMEGISNPLTDQLIHSWLPRVFESIKIRSRANIAYLQLQNLAQASEAITAMNGKLIRSGGEIAIIAAAHSEFDPWESADEVNEAELSSTHCVHVYYPGSLEKLRQWFDPLSTVVKIVSNSVVRAASCLNSVTVYVSNASDVELLISAFDCRLIAGKRIRVLSNLVKQGINPTDDSAIEHKFLAPTTEQAPASRISQSWEEFRRFNQTNSPVKPSANQSADSTGDSLVSDPNSDFPDPTNALEYLVDSSIDELPTAFLALFEPLRLFISFPGLQLNEAEVRHAIETIAPIAHIQLNPADYCGQITLFRSSDVAELFPTPVPTKELPKPKLLIQRRFLVGKNKFIDLQRIPVTEVDVADANESTNKLHTNGSKLLILTGDHLTHEADRYMRPSLPSFEIHLRSLKLIRRQIGFYVNVMEIWSIGAQSFVRIPAAALTPAVETRLNNFLIAIGAGEPVARFRMRIADPVMEVEMARTIIDTARALNQIAPMNSKNKFDQPQTLEISSKEPFTLSGPQLSHLFRHYSPLLSFNLNRASRRCFVRVQSAAAARAIQIAFNNIKFEQLTLNIELVQKERVQF